MVTKIKTLHDVEAFAKALVNEGTAFHPDEDFTTYVKNGKKAFSEEDAHLRNTFMASCIEVCEKEGVDIYDFMLEISLKETGMDALIPLPSQIN